MLNTLLAGNRKWVLLLAIAAGAAALLLLGGDDDEGTGAGNSLASGYVDGACVKQVTTSTPVPGAPGSYQQSGGLPEVVDCDDPLADGTLREVASEKETKDCPGTGITIFKVDGEAPEGTGSFCVDPKEPAVP